MYRGISGQYLHAVTIVNLLTYLHKNPLSDKTEIMQGCNLSIAAFYKHLRTIEAFKVVVSQLRTKGYLCKYFISDYGLFDRDKLPKQTKKELSLFRAKINALPVKTLVLLEKTEFKTIFSKNESK